MGLDRQRADTAGLVELLASLTVYLYAGDRPAGRVRFEPLHLGVDQQGHVGLVQQRPHGDGVGVGLRVHQARVAVAGGAADALASPAG